MAQPAEQLVGRAEELGVLDDALAVLDGRRPAALELVGEPGIGKTRLLRELGQRADAQGRLVLAGSASELEGELPFWVFVDALDEYLKGLEPRRLESLDDDVRAELAQVFPAVSVGEDRPAGHDDRYRTHRAVRQLLEALAASKPLVLLLDDLHWADSGSVELLGSLLRRPPAGVLMALALRPRQVPERLSGALGRAHDAGALTRIELGALTADEARQLLGDGVDGEAAAALYAESGGNPFYLQQLARSPRRVNEDVAVDVAAANPEVPRAVTAALSDELALLPDEARRVLEGAAVAGDPFEPELAAAAAAVPEAAAVEALDELLVRDLIRPTDVPRRFGFRHPLVRHAVYEAAPGGWRLGAHERTARALAVRGAPAAARAHHVERSARHGDVDAVSVLREAGESASPLAPATAARLFAAAIRLLPPSTPASERVALLSALAGAHAAAGQFYEAHGAMLESLEELPDDAVASRVKLTAGCAGLENLIGRHEEAHTRLITALDGLADMKSPEAAELMIQLAVDAFYRMDYPSMRDWAQRALDTARTRGDPPLTASAAGVLTLANMCCGEIAEADVTSSEAAALVDSMRDEELASCLDLAIDTLAVSELYLDRYDSAGTHIERSLRIARATGQGQVLPVLFWTGVIRTARGRLADAAGVLDTAVEIARLSGHTEGLAWNLFSRSLAATAAGDADTALATAEEAAAALRDSDETFLTMGVAGALAAALAEAGESQRAVAALLQAGGGEELPLVPSCWRAAAFELLTRSWLAAGRPDQAERAATRAASMAQALGLRMPAAMAERARAAVALESGDAASAADLALASADGAAEIGAVIEAALSRLLAGRALAAAGAKERAASELGRAAAAFDACGAAARRDAAERELGKLGRRTHRRTRRGKAGGTPLESLTERELEVARLIVDRRTNAQIAAQLFLSPKTVETHVRHLFEKLGVSSRVEVARLVERGDREAARQ